MNRRAIIEGAGDVIIGLLRGTAIRDAVAIAVAGHLGTLVVVRERAEVRDLVRSLCAWSVLRQLRDPAPRGFAYVVAFEGDTCGAALVSLSQQMAGAA